MTPGRPPARRLTWLTWLVWRLRVRLLTADSGIVFAVAFALAVIVLALVIGALADGPPHCYQVSARGAMTCR